MSDPGVPHDTQQQPHGVCELLRSPSPGVRVPQGSDDGLEQCSQGREEGDKPGGCHTSPPHHRRSSPPHHHTPATPRHATPPLAACHAHPVCKTHPLGSAEGPCRPPKRCCEWTVPPLRHRPLPDHNPVGKERGGWEERGGSGRRGLHHARRPRLTLRAPTASQCPVLIATHVSRGSEQCQAGHELGQGTSYDLGHGAAKVTGDASSSCSDPQRRVPTLDNHGETHTHGHQGRLGVRQPTSHQTVVFGTVCEQQCWTVWEQLCSTLCGNSCVRHCVRTALFDTVCEQLCLTECPCAALHPGGSTTCPPCATLRPGGLLAGHGR
jgi:hypothetical protein